MTDDERGVLWGIAVTLAVVGFAFFVAWAATPSNGYLGGSCYGDHACHDVCRRIETPKCAVKTPPTNNSEMPQ